MKGTLGDTVHAVFTVTGTSTAGFNSTEQVKKTIQPVDCMVLFLVTITEDGAGTAMSFQSSSTDLHCEYQYYSVNLLEGFTFIEARPLTSLTLIWQL